MSGAPLSQPFEEEPLSLVFDFLGFALGLPTLVKILQMSGLPTLETRLSPTEFGKALKSCVFLGLGGLFLEVPLVESAQGPALPGLGPLLTVEPPLDLTESFLFEVCPLFQVLKASVQGLQSRLLLFPGGVDLLGALMKSL